jgi:hypothetical protein
MSKKKNGKAKATAKSDPDRVPLTQAMGTKAKGKGAKKLSCLDAAAQVLKTKGEAMNCKGMIDAMFAAKLWHSEAPTPAATLYSAILREITHKKSEARFKKTDRGLFVLSAK